MKTEFTMMVMKKLQIFMKRGCAIDIIWIQKQGDEQQLGICDMGENDAIVESTIKVIPMTLASEKATIGETANNMALGNNAESYFEFAEIGEQSNIRTGDRIRYNREEYIIFEILPVVMGETLLCRQYKAKKVL